MKNAFLILVLVLVGCADGADVYVTADEQALQTGDASCSTSDGSPCFCGTAGCDGEPGGGTGGGTGGGGGGTGGGDPYTEPHHCTAWEQIPNSECTTEWYGEPGHRWRKSCCDNWTQPWSSCHWVETWCQVEAP